MKNKHGRQSKQEFTPLEIKLETKTHQGGRCRAHLGRVFLRNYDLVSEISCWTGGKQSKGQRACVL